MGTRNFRAEGVKKFSGGSIESNYSVCPCPLHWFYAFLHQTEQLLGTPFSVNLHQFTGDGRGGKGEG